MLLLALAAAPTLATAADTNESRLHRDFRVEMESLAACTKFGFASLTDCGQTLVLGQPMHITAGSLAPQNGIAAGLAFVDIRISPMNGGSVGTGWPGFGQRIVACRRIHEGVSASRRIQVSGCAVV